MITISNVDRVHTFKAGTAHLHVTHGAKVVDLLRADSGDQLGEVGGVREVPIVQEEPCVCVMAVFVDVLNAGGIE